MCPAHRRRLHGPVRGSKYSKKHDVFHFVNSLHTGTITLDSQPCNSCWQCSCRCPRSSLPLCQKSNTTIPHLIGSLDHLINKILRLYIPTTKTKVRRQHSLSPFVRRTSKFLLLPLAILFELYLHPSISSSFVQVLISLTNDSLNRTFPSFCSDRTLPSDVPPIVPRNPNCQQAIDLGQTMLQHVVIGARSF